MNYIKYDYNEINAFVTKRIQEVGIEKFDFLDVNLVKVIQWGLIWSFKKEKQVRKLNFEWGKPILILKLIRLFKWIKAKPVKNIYESKTLFIDNVPRVTRHENGLRIPRIFYRVVEKEGRDDFTFLSYSAEYDVLKEKTIYYSDLDQSQLSCKLNDRQVEVYRELFQLRKTLRDNLTSDEFQKVDYCLMIFWLTYNLYSNIFSLVAPERVFYICHYNNEGIAFAAKEHGIRTIELQHGLISKSDLYYCYADWMKPVREKALLTDELWVFGEFWRQRLLSTGNEYLDFQVKTKGYYFYDPIPSAEESEKFAAKKGVQEKKVVLIASQTWSYERYNDYVKWLSNELLSKEEVVIVLKIHPRSEESQYSPLKDLQNVIIDKDDLSLWMSISLMHISIYSTTLFDANRFEHLLNSNYCLLHPEYDEYTSEMIEDNIALPLKLKENPFKKKMNQARKKNVEFYSEYS